jgi:hypothetical protein
MGLTSKSRSPTGAVIAGQEMENIGRAPHEREYARLTFPRDLFS